MKYNISRAVRQQPFRNQASATTPENKPSVPIPAPYRPAQEVKCQKCKARGYLRSDVPYGHPKFGTPGVVRCKCQAPEEARRRHARAFSWLGADEAQVRKMVAATFDLFDPQANGRWITRAYQQARNYAESLKVPGAVYNNCLFIGPCGTGKTHLACAICNAAGEAGIGCLFVSGDELFQRLYAANFDRQIFQQAIEIDVLCLDDLDKMQQTEDGSFQKAQLYTLFDQRYKAGRPTIITANKDDDWRPWLLEASISRLFEHREAIRMQGQDYRLRWALKS